jgi:hypothetical protein
MCFDLLTGKYQKREGEKRERERERGREREIERERERERAKVVKPKLNLMSERKKHCLTKSENYQTQSNKKTKRKLIVSERISRFNKIKYCSILHPAFPTNSLFFCILL